MGVLNKKI